MRASRRYRMAETKLKDRGGVRRVVAEMYDAGSNAEEIAQYISSQISLPVSEDTIWRWQRKWQEEQHIDTEPGRAVGAAGVATG